MHKQYKQYVYTLVVNMLIPLGAQSVQELQRMKSEYDKLEQQRSQQQNDVSQKQYIDQTIGLPSQAKITPYILPSSEEYKEITSHFGYDFFTKRDTVSFWENLPTPVNYLLGPGDVLVISLWGETQLRQTYTISREGKIYDTKVGLLNLTGKNIQEGKDVGKGNCWHWGI